MGLLYAVPDDDLAAIEEGEGGYRRELLPVRMIEEPILMLVYLAKQPSNDPGLHPYTWYMRLLVTAHGTRICPDYFAELEHGSQLAPLH